MYNTTSRALHQLSFQKVCMTSLLFPLRAHQVAVGHGRVERELPPPLLLSVPASLDGPPDPKRDLPVPPLEDGVERVKVCFLEAVEVRLRCDLFSRPKAKIPNSSTSEKCKVRARGGGGGRTAGKKAAIHSLPTLLPSHSLREVSSSSFALLASS